jgi:hypothetical protein
LDACNGQCCVEGDAGAPVTLDEVGDIEDSLDAAWSMSCRLRLKLSSTNRVWHIQMTEGDTGNEHCRTEKIVSLLVMTKAAAYCALEKAFRAGKTEFCKPISCYLYPISEVKIGKDMVGLNYHVWDICKCAREKGKELNLRVYQFLKQPLIDRFGAEWYKSLEEAVAELKAKGYIK